MTVQTSFDRRTFLQASGILAVGFSMAGTAGANTLHAPKSVAKEAVDSWLTISPDNKVTIFVGKVDSVPDADRAGASPPKNRRFVRADRNGMGDTATITRPMVDRRQPDHFPGWRERRRPPAPCAGGACGATARCAGRDWTVRTAWCA